jgi:hypothetical protein
METLLVARHYAAQRIRCLNIEIETASLLINHHAIITPGRF